MEKDTVAPALETLEALQDAVLKRIGKQDGNLNGKLKAQFQTLKQILYNLDTMESMNKTINQQSQLMGKVINDAQRVRETMEQMLKQQHLALTGDTNGTKGE